MGISRLERYRGCLLGLAAGDAVGTTVEFSTPGSFKPLVDMVGGGPFKLAPGQWTDDTSMALCLAESLIERRGLDLADQLERYVRWWKEGHLSANGVCFDIGNTVREALQKFQRLHDPHSGSTDPGKAGNGSIMRLAPVPMAYAKDPRRALEMSAESSRSTHGAQTAVDACRYLGGLIVGALAGASKDDLLQAGYLPVPGEWQRNPLHAAIAEVAQGSYKTKQPPEIVGSGYVVKSLEAALWAFFRSTDFREGCLLAVNLGDDADTTAAIYGQLAGAFYGEAGIPQAWREKLAMRDVIESFADQLFNFSETGPLH